MRSAAASLVVGTLLMVACSPAASDGGSGGAGGFGAAGAGAVGGAAGMAGSGGGNTGPCLTFETQPCTCGSLPGRSVCTNGTWLPCECAGSLNTGGPPGQDPPGNKRADLMWDWIETMPTGSCKPGHYEGNFDGFYSSSLTFVGVPIPVAGLSSDPTMPPLEFDLMAGSGSGEILSVSGGHMKGMANGAFPFQFDIEGELDCATLKFNATLVNGWYMVGPVMVTIGGPLTADYDPVTGSMVNGHWIVAEPGHTTTPPFPLGWYGGEGAWHAMHIP